MLRLRLKALLGVVGAALLPSTSCASKFSNAESNGLGGIAAIAGSGGSSAGRGGTGARAGTAGRAGTTSKAGGSGKGGTGDVSGHGGDTANAGEPTMPLGGASNMAGTGAAGAAGGVANAGVPGEAGEQNAGMGGTAGAPPLDPISHDGLVYWFSADVGVTVTNGGVSKWQNRADSTANAVQISPGARPRLDHFADGSLPAVVFDGQDDYLGLPPLVTTFETGVTFFAVAQPTDGSYCMPMLELSNGEEIDDVNFGWLSTALAYEVFDRSVQGQNGAFPLGEPRLAEVTHDSSGAVALWMNSLPNGIENFALPASITRQQTFIGKSLYHACTTWNGELAELILYARPLDLTERQAVETYLQAKWSCCGI